MNSIKRMMMPVSRANRAKASTSSSLMPRTRTAFTLAGAKRDFCATSMLCITVENAFVLVTVVFGVVRAQLVAEEDVAVRHRGGQVADLAAILVMKDHTLSYSFDAPASYLVGPQLLMQNRPIKSLASGARPKTTHFRFH